MQRRVFIGCLGAALAAPSEFWPITAGAQSVPVIGYLYSGPRALNVGLPGFAKGLREAGYVEGQNLKVEYRFADGQLERVPGLAAEPRRPWRRGHFCG